MIKKLDKIDQKITTAMKIYGITTLRYSLAVIFIWFGLLKILNTSPAETLVAKTVYFVSPIWFVPFLGYWEILIGVLLLYKPFNRIGLLLMGVQMIGTFLPLLILPEVVYGRNMLFLTLEGQYIIKNLVLIGAAIIIGSHVRDKK